jgi:hypothetical protein
MEPVILIGVQGSGKSTFYKERFNGTHIRINPDMLKTRNREKIIFHERLEARHPVVSVISTRPAVIGGRYTRAGENRSIQRRGPLRRTLITIDIERRVESDFQRSGGRSSQLFRKH